MIHYSNLELYIVKENISIFELAKKINLNGKGFALVKDSRDRIIGIFTDGDLRRLLLKRIDLNSKIKDYLKKNFIYADKDSINKKSINHKNTKQIPILNKKKKLLGVYFKSYDEKSILDTSVFILAGGLGKRMGFLTKRTPKPMLKINKRPILENIILSFKNQGFVNFIISVNYLAKKITSYFKEGKFLDVNIRYVKENAFLGTAGPLGLLNKKLLTDQIFIINGDVYSNLNFSDMLRIHKKEKNQITVCAKLHTFDLPYGLIEEKRKENFLNEKPKLTYLVNSGIYIINKELLRFIKKNTYLDMNELLNLFKKKRFRIGIYSLYEPVFDIGNLKQYREIKKNLA